MVLGRLVLDGRFEVAGRLDALGLAERFDWDARLVDPDRAGLDRFTLALVLGRRPPARCPNSIPDSRRVGVKIRTITKMEKCLRTDGGFIAVSSELRLLYRLTGTASIRSEPGGASNSKTVLSGILVAHLRKRAEYTGFPGASVNAMISFAGKG